MAEIGENMEPEETPRPSAALALDQGLRGLIAEASLWRERSDIFNNENAEVLKDISRLQLEQQKLAESAKSFKAAYHSTNTPLPSEFDEVFINMLCHGVVMSESDFFSGGESPEPENDAGDDEEPETDDDPTEVDPGDPDPDTEPEEPEEPEDEEFDPEPDPDPIDEEE